MTSRPQKALSIIVLPSGDRAEPILAVARAWAAEGLLKRGLWVPSEKVELSQHGGAVVHGTLLDHTQSTEQNVARVLAGLRLSELTMVILQVCTQDHPVDHAQVRAGDLLAEAIVNSRPESLTADGGEDPVTFRVINLLTGPTGMSRVPFIETASRHYSMAVVASPEDRRAADQMDRFVRPGDNLMPWATAQACTLAGLWSGMEQSPWDARVNNVDGDSSFAQGDFAVPMRSFARVVTSAPTARRALALAMDGTRSALGNPLTSERVLPVSDPEAVIRPVLDATDHLDNGRLRYETPASKTPPSRAKTPLRKALGEFSRFSAREVLGVPRFVVQRSSSGLSRRATSVLSGDEGVEEITVLGEGGDLRIYQEQFERQSLEAEHRMRSLPADVPPSAPDLWRALAQTTLGLLDGSKVHPDIPQPIVDEQRVVLPTAHLAVPPPTDWASDHVESAEVLASAELEIRKVPSCSPSVADRVKAESAQDLARSQARHKKANAALLQATAALKADGDEDEAGAVAARVCAKCGTYIEPGLASCPECEADSGEEGPTDGSADDEAEEAAPPYEGRAARRLRLTLELRKAELEVAAANEQLTLARRLEESFSEWLGERQNSMFWRLCRRLDDRTQSAQSDMEAFQAQAMEIPEIDIDEPRRARNQFANRFLAWLAVTLLLVLVTWQWGSALADTVGVPHWVPWAVVVVTLVVWLSIVLTSYYRRRSRFLKVVQDLLFDQRSALDRWVESARAYNRLAGLSQQLVEWAEILGFVVHDTWHPEERWFSGVLESEFGATLPSCVDLAVPDPEDELGTQLLQRAATKSITGEGWRTAAFHGLHDLLLRDGGFDPNTPGATSRLFEDSPATPNGTRRAMLGLLRSGRLQQQCARSVLEAKLAGLYAERNALMSHAVLPINSEFAAENTGLLDDASGLEKVRPTWGEYLQSALVGETRFGVALWSTRGRTDNRSRSVMTTVRYAPPGLFAEPLMTQSVHPALSADKNRGVEVVVRCDFGPAVDKSSLLIFSQEDLVEDPAFKPPENTGAGTGQRDQPVRPVDVDLFN